MSGHPTYTEDLTGHRQRQLNTLRSTLREFYPAALQAFGDNLGTADALAVLGRAPTPAQGRALTRPQIVAALHRSGRRRNLETRATQIQVALRAPQLEAPGLIADAFGASVTATVTVVVELNTQIDRLQQQLAAAFEGHPDAEILHSLPGLGVVLGARVLAEFGDAPNRYADAKSHKNYAGTSPITKASGTRRVVLARYARNRRLSDAVQQWAFCSLTRSPGARQYYDSKRAAGATHHQALRALGNRLVGILHGCLRHHTPYQEHIAWPPPLEAAA
jgi:transposase